MFYKYNIGIQINPVPGLESHLPDLGIPLQFDKPIIPQDIGVGRELTGQHMAYLVDYGTLNYPLLKEQDAEWLESHIQSASDLYEKTFGRVYKEIGKIGIERYHKIESEFKERFIQAHYEFILTLLQEGGLFEQYKEQVASSSATITNPDKYLGMLLVGFGYPEDTTISLGYRFHLIDLNFTANKYVTLFNLTDTVREHLKELIDGVDDYEGLAEDKLVTRFKDAYLARPWVRGWEAFGTRYDRTRNELRRAKVMYKEAKGAYAAVLARYEEGKASRRVPRAQEELIEPGISQLKEKVDSLMEERDKLARRFEYIKEHAPPWWIELNEKRKGAPENPGRGQGRELQKHPWEIKHPYALCRLYEAYLNFNPQTQKP